METVGDVVGKLRAVEASGAATDGVVCFARLYRTVTEGVAARLRADTFQKPTFVEALDVRFAELFFSAYASARDGHTMPPAWAPLFEQRADRRIRPIQFAIAGMNAHINRDLPVALVATCKALDVQLRDASPEHANYVRVNGLLADVESRVKTSYLSGLESWAARLAHRFDHSDDVVAMWDVRRARDAAWANAKVLWGLRDEPELSAEFLLTLDRMVGLASRGLLVPAQARLAQLARRVARTL